MYLRTSSKTTATHLIQEVVDDLLQIRQVGVQQSRPEPSEIRMLGVVDLDYSPWVTATSDLLTVGIDDLFRADDGEWEEGLRYKWSAHCHSRPGQLRKASYPKFTVVLNRVLIILLNVVGEVVDGNLVVFDILHDLAKRPNIRPSQLRPSPESRALTLFLKASSSEGVRVSAFPMTGMTFTLGDNRRISSISISRRLSSRKKTPSVNFSDLSPIEIARGADVRMSGGRDKVKEGVYTVVPEPGVTFDPRFLGENVIVLPFEVTDDPLEAASKKKGRWSEDGVRKSAKSTKTPTCPRC